MSVAHKTDSVVQKIAPGPRGLPVLGSIPDLRSQGILDFYIEVWREFGDVARVQMGPMTIHQFVRPEHVQYILVKNQKNYLKGFSHDKLRVPLGMGILTSEGELWRRQRRLMSPTYTPKAVTQFAGIMLNEVQKTLERWQAHPAGEPLAINVEMMRLAMSVISRSMFTIDIGEDFAEAGTALSFILEFANKRTMTLIDPPLFIPTPMNQKLKRSLKTLDDFLYGIIAERRQQPPGDDLLSILMHARDEETGEVMSDKQLRDEALITFFAGHETTAQLLTWSWFLLSKHPETEENLHEELARVLGGRSPGLDDLDDLVYTRMVLDETLRLYSPVAVMARDAVDDDEIDGFFIPAGSMVTINPYITHRHPEFWEKPDAFYPEHFTPEQVEARPRYAYYPFGAGPRICLGKHFALLEAVLALSEMAQHYQLQLVSGQEIHESWSGTLRPNRDVMMILHRRVGNGV
jgi:cytochrome P450